MKTKTDNNSTIESERDDLLFNSLGYKVAISFKPFINPACTEHMEIVKDMAKSINRAINTPESKGMIFNRGYEEGKTWQKEKDRQIIKNLMNQLGEQLK